MNKTLLEKLKYVKMHVDDNVPIYEVKNKYGISSSTLKYLSKLYIMHGEKPFNKDVERKSYTKEMKLKAIKDHDEGLSTREIALNLQLSDPKIVQDWIKLYRKFGESAIKDTYSREAYKMHDDKILEKEYKKLLEDLERTKAENEFLKKSFPQVLKESKRLNKKL